MSNLRVTNPLESSATMRNLVPCCNSTIIKISLFIFGLMLVSAAIASYIYQVNTIAVYTTMGGIGGFLIFAAAVASIMQCISSKRLEARASRDKGERRDELQKQAHEEKLRWRKFAQDGHVEAIRNALTNKTLSEDRTRLLHIAAKNGQAELVGLLIENGADTNLVTRFDDSCNKTSAIHLANICNDYQKGLETMRVTFDGVWASASFLHIPKKNLLSVFKSLYLFLKPEGIFYLSLKKGSSEWLQQDKRYGNRQKFWSFFEDKEIITLLEEADFEVLESAITEKSSSYQTHPKIYVFCKKARKA